MSDTKIVAPITVTTSTCCGDLPNADHDRCSFCGERASFAETDIEDYVRGTRGDGTQPRHPDFDGDEQAEREWERLMTAKLGGALPKPTLSLSRVEQERLFAWAADDETFAAEMDAYRTAMDGSEEF